ncbi:hemin-degrading factor (plasmid) [Cereibacter azotoformans]|uniref:ChuX/HutX family heme-like substrate-binding protein n=1 Tax=Cereibacter azotoformans TaxID=43057 RepID=UPI001EEC2C53|nr:ChuX/HutX family heme-like substrate-binding protein [Cereibacter azotoformans]ULB12429.1 hemin-degrading factor [Cereibacter azotoformans]
MLDSAFPVMPRHITDLPEGSVALAAHPDRLIPALDGLGPLVAATANPACRIARTGPYRDYQGGSHASMVFDEAVDLRFFPAHWVQARAVMAEGTRAIHVFDAAGDAVHCITATEGTDAGRWADLVTRLATDEAPPPLTERPAPEAPRANPARVDELRADWDRMTDTHQFLRLVARLKMNRLGAYRIAGEPYARTLAPAAVPQLLRAASADGLPLMAFVGNRGCIQIHGGPIPGLAVDSDRLTVRNPDLSFDLDCARIAEVWAVTKPTRAGPALSVEVFEADGSLIAQLFGLRRAGDAAVAAWDALVAAELTAEARA